MAFFVGVPMLAASVLVAIAVVGGLAASRVRSGVRAGIVGTLAGWLAGAAVFLTRLLLVI